MRHDEVYIISEGPMSQPQYCIRTRATYQGPARIMPFHIFKTVETVPRLLTAHEHNIIGIEPEHEKAASNHKNGA